MQFIDSNVEIIEQEPGLLGVYKQIERAARLSYKSEDRITENSAKKMVDTLVKNKHLGCLEHGTIYLEVPMNKLGARINSKYVSNKYSISRNSLDCYTFCITTNARVLVENGWLDDLQYMFNPTEYHKKRVSVKFTTSIGITRELIRHRAFSFMNESTRYCNYSKGKFGSELTFVIPEWIYAVRAEIASYPDPLTHDSREWLMNKYGEDLIEYLCCFDRSVSSWYDCLSRIEEDYNYLTTTNEGYQLKAQEARGILPMDTKSEIIMTGFVDDWLHFFALRSHIATTGKPHPDVQKLADELLQEFLNRGYITNEDVKKLEDEKKKKNKLIRTIKASILCARFPFLYPRNRWDGKHHAYKLNKILYKLNEEAITELGITATRHEPIEKLSTHADSFNVTVDLDIENRKLIIKNHLETKEYNLYDLLWRSNDKFTILGMTAFWNNSNNVTIYVKTTDENDKTNYGFQYDKVKLLNNKSKLRWYKILKWIDENILDKICFFPDHTELDALEPGWRKKFGIDICKEIKRSLLKYGGIKALMRYRIVQIKEKFGGLRWYDNGGTEEILKEIIPKYNRISRETCVCCGKPAKYVSAGWVSPYCEDCIDNKHNYVPITEENAWDKAYTYYWPKKEE